MLLTPTELERLTIFTAAELARKRRARGLKLNHPEAVALITDEILEGAREGKSVATMMSLGSTILSTNDVMPGVAAMVPILQVEGVFPDGTKLVTIHEPIRPAAGAAADMLEPGRIVAGEGDVELSAGRPRVTVQVTNTGDRPVQIGSHYHFFEVNKALDFDRAAAFAMRPTTRCAAQHSNGPAPPASRVRSVAMELNRALILRSDPKDRVSKDEGRQRGACGHPSRRPLRGLLRMR